jgi:hypothetical protein
MSFLSTLEPHVFLYIMSSISEGLTAIGGTLNHFTGTVQLKRTAIEHTEQHKTDSVSSFFIYDYSCDIPALIWRWGLTYIFR